MEPIMLERHSEFSSTFSQTLEIWGQRDRGQFKKASGWIVKAAQGSSRLKGILQEACREMTDGNNSTKTSPQNSHNVSTVLNSFSNDMVLISNFFMKGPSQR